MNYNKEYIEIKCSKCNELLGFQKNGVGKFTSPSGIYVSYGDEDRIYFCKSCKQLMKLKE